MEVKEGALGVAVVDKVVESEDELLGITLRTEAKTLCEALFGNSEEILF